MKRKGKHYEDLVGKEKAAIWKERISLSKKGKPHKIKISKGNKKYRSLKKRG